MLKGPMQEESGIVVKAAHRVHTRLGPGLLESAYEACLAYEIRKRGLDVRCQVPLAVDYDEVRLDIGYRIDLVVESTILIETKAVLKLAPVHAAQILSYMRLGGYPVGLLMNFHALRMQDGIKRFVDDQP